MKIMNYEIITVRKKAKDTGSRAPLLTDEGSLTPEAAKVFNDMFTKLSSPDGFMYPSDSVKFLKHVNGYSNDYVNEDNPTLKSFFAQYDPENLGYITREEFLRFYTEKSEKVPETVWRNLQNAKIGNDLKPIDPDSQEDPYEVKSPEELPRYFIAQDPAIYQSLVELLNVLPTRAQDEMWNIFQLLSPNLDHLRGLLLGDPVVYLTEKGANTFDLLYCLQLCDNLILFDPLTPLVTTTAYYKNPEMAHYSAINAGTYDFNKKEPKKRFEEALSNLLQGPEDS